MSGGGGGGGGNIIVEMCKDGDQGICTHILLLF